MRGKPIKYQKVHLFNEIMKINISSERESRHDVVNVYIHGVAKNRKTKASS